MLLHVVSLWFWNIFKCVLTILSCSKVQKQQVWDTIPKSKNMYKICINGGFPKLGVPQNGCFTRKKKTLKWMMTAGRKDAARTPRNIFGISKERQVRYNKKNGKVKLTLGLHPKVPFNFCTVVILHNSADTKVPPFWGTKLLWQQWHHGLAAAATQRLSCSMHPVAAVDPGGPCWGTPILLDTGWVKPHMLGETPTRVLVNPHMLGETVFFFSCSISY